MSPGLAIRLAAPLFLGLLAIDLAWSQEAEPFVEVRVTPEQVAVGEPVTIRVSVFVPTWFPKPPQFPSFEMPNAVTRLPPNSSRPATKRVGRDTWSGVSRTYQVYPLLGARFRLESQTIDLQYANPGSDPVRAQVDTGEIVFTALVPEGAESLDPYVAGTRLELNRDVEGNNGTLGVGDAVVVTYVAELDGLSAIFLPEIVEPPDLPGVSVYPEQPIVDDSAPARRTEKLTFIFNAGGSFEIPAVAIDWWNSETGQIETASLPVLPIAVEGPPIGAETAQEPATERSWWLAVAAIVVIGLLVRGLYGRAAAIRTRVEERERQRLSSEPYAWKQVSKALNRGDAHRAHDEIVRWLQRLDPGSDSRRFAARYGDGELGTELATLNRSLYADSGEKADLGKIQHRLSAARKRCLAERSRGLGAALPPLNP